MNKYYDRKKQVRIISCIIIIITLLIMIGSLCIYLYINDDSNKDDNKGVRITEKQIVSKKSKKTTTTRKAAIIGTTITTTTTTEKLKYELAAKDSNYKNSLPDWEWNVANLINQYREDNGLSTLRVSSELRLAAEQIADNDLINNNFTNNKYLILKDENIGYSTGYKELFNYVISDRKFKLLKNIEWIGIGVIYKNNTHYFCLIYE